MTNSSELPVPEAVQSSLKAMELLRVWIADGDQVLTISPALWNDPGTWGLMLVDLAKHVAAAYEAKALRQEDTLASIRAAMDAEWL